MSSYRLRTDAFSKGASVSCDLGDCTPLNGANTAICAALLPTVTQRTFRAGEYIESISANQITFLAVGMVRLEWSLRDGRRQVLDFRVKGDVLRPANDLPGARIIAVTPGVLYQTTEESLKRCDKWRGGGNHWRGLSAQDYLQRAVNQVMMLGQLTAIEKVAAFLEDLAARSGVPDGNHTSVALPMGRDDIADYLGLNAETVSRQLSRLRSDGVLALPKPNQVVIRNRSTLRNMSPFTAVANTNLPH